MRWLNIGHLGEEARDGRGEWEENQLFFINLGIDVLVTMSSYYFYNLKMIKKKVKYS
jgi:hypothetical protein